MRENYNSTKNLTFFFAATLLWTWTAGFAPVWLGITGTPLGTFIFYFGGGAPSVVALLMVFTTYPAGARKDYFARCFSLKRMGWKWPLWTVGFLTLITLVGLGICDFLNLERPGMDFIHAVLNAPYMIFPVLLISFVSGPLNEEFGWRGYALDKLLVRTGFHGASLILGFIWAIWHLAWYFTPGQAQYNLMQSSVLEAFMYIPSLMVFNYVVTFVYIKTNRSVLAGAVVHMLGNLINSQLLSPYSVETGMVIRYVKMAFCLTVAVYTAFSASFKAEVEIQIESIKESAP
jgi:membrane protease YdiL (CAAX protease family)